MKDGIYEVETVDHPGGVIDYYVGCDDCDVFLELLSWLCESIECYHLDHSIVRKNDKEFHAELVIKIKYKEDAVAFKLRWL